MDKAVMFIHDAWLTPDVWERFAGRYAACGYRCTAPPWPLEAGSAGVAAATGTLATRGMAALVDHFERMILAQAAAPILVGHGFGGLCVQMLLDRGRGAAGIAIAPLPPRGIFPGLATWRNAFSSLSGWRDHRQALALTQARFARDLAHTLEPAAQALAFQRYVVPVPGKIFRQAAIGLGNQVNFCNDNRAPLLFIAADGDRMVPPSVVAANYRRQRRSITATDLLHFAGRSHWLLIEPGWEQVADASIEWLQRHSGRF